MSRSNRSERFALVVLALCGAVVSAVIVWDVYIRSSHRYADYEAYRQYERDQSANEIAIGCGAKPDCISKKLKTRDAKNNSNDDLTAQQKMAFWTGFMGLFTALMTALTAVAVWFVFRTAQFTRDTLTQARRTNDAAWETLNATIESGRAWLVFDMIDPQFSNDAVIVEENKRYPHVAAITIVYKNLGSTPAFDVQHHMSFALIKYGDMANFKEIQWRNDTGSIVGQGQALRFEPLLIGYQRHDNVIARGMHYFIRASVRYKTKDSKEWRYSIIYISLTASGIQIIGEDKIQPNIVCSAFSKMSKVT